MADKIQAQKLAAARRMLKEYKKKTLPNRKASKQVGTEETTEVPEKINSAATSGNATPAESVASSAQSIVDVCSASAESALQPDPNQYQNNSSNFFNQSLFSAIETNHLLSNYFDNLPENTNVLDAFPQNQNESVVDAEAGNRPVLCEFPDRTRSESALDDAEPENQNFYSNTESLRQLSSQIHSLLDGEAGHVPAEGPELERRNQELGAALTQERLRSEQLSVQLREYMTRVTQLEAEVQQVRNEHEAKLSRELGPLQDQLQYHVQTVGILVGEKTELSVALTQSQNVAKQKTVECEELQVRMRASKQRAAGLDKELDEVRTARDELTQRSQDAVRELDKLRLENGLLREQQREQSDECSELRDKLNAKRDECLAFQQQLQERQAQLALAQLRAEQLAGADGLQAESQVEALSRQKLSLEQQVNELAQTVRQLSSERAQAGQQYQQYVQQLNAQLQGLADSLAAKSKEADALARREQELVAHVSELETLMQQNNHNQQEEETNASLVAERTRELERLQAALSELEAERDDAEAKQKTATERVAKLEAEVQDKTATVAELEARLEEAGDQPDAGKLLAAMESDKVAASRAVEQNLKLKEQLQELHDAFIKISDSKLQLTEDLQAEQHKCRELTDKISQASTAIEHLHSVIAMKDKQLMNVQMQLDELEKKVLQQEQLSDRLRHYEAQDHSSEFVQHELQQLQDENEQLKKQLDIVPEPQADADKSQPQPHTDELKDIIEKLEQSNLELMEKLNAGEQEQQPDNVHKNEYLDREKAMQKLEERFKQTMADVANLTEEKQRLEHLVLQLQGETETIGEYVTLYQCQRAMLREKILEKDAQLKRLARDRIEVQSKLEELNALVKKLLPTDALHKRLFSEAAECALQPPETAPARQVNGAVHDNNNDDTADKIISLLSEIKTSRLVQPGDAVQNFHPCPWCSGQLITV